MLEYNEIKPKKFIVYENEPYEVIESHVARTQQRKPQNQVKMRNMLNGRVIPTTFHASDKVEEAEVYTKKIKYLFSNKGEFWFCEEKDASKRFTLPETLIGNQGKFLKPNTLVDALIFTYDDEDKTIGIKMPVKIELEIKDAPPGIKGNTAQGGTKLATLETGATINVPLFINIGDVVRINTETGEYTERVDKR